MNTLNLPTSIKEDVQYFELENGLKVAALCSSDVTFSIYSLAVNSGSYSDPFDFQGLAHMAEHTVTMGCKKFPSHSYYEEAHANNNGFSNATTTGKYTSYFGNIETNKFEVAIDALTAHLAAPLFEQEALEKEIKAVHSEYYGKKDNPIWKLQIFNKHIANEKSIMSKFSAGNRDTLWKNGLKEALIDFHSSYYSADKMGFFAKTNMSVEEFKSKICPLLAAIPKFETRQDELSTVPSFNSTNMNKIYTTEAIEGEKRLSINFLFPDCDKYYKTKPINYIGTFLLNGEEDSTISWLKNEGLIIDFSMELENIAEGLSLLNVVFNLTDKGNKEWKTIAQKVFYLLRVMKEKVYEEVATQIKVLSEINFNNTEIEGDYQRIMSSAEKVHAFGRDFLSAETLIDEVSIKDIQTYLDWIKLENMSIVHCSGEGEFDKLEKWSNLKYRVESIDKELAVYLTEVEIKERCIPPVNPFIPKDLTVFDFEGKTKEPAFLKETDLYRIFYKTDSTYNTPKVCFQGYLALPKIFDKYEEDHAIKLVYAEIAKNRFRGLHHLVVLESEINITAIHEGILFKILAPSETAVKILEEMRKALDFNPLELKELERFKESVFTFYSTLNKYNIMDYGHLFHLDQTCGLTVPSISLVGLTNLMNTRKELFTAENLAKVHDSLFKSSFLHLNVLGNMSREKAIETAEWLCTSLGFSPLKDLTKIVPAKLERKEVLCLIDKPLFDKENDDATLVIELGGVYESMEISSLVMALLGDAMSEELRTKKGLGYGVTLMPYYSFGKNYVVANVSGHEYSSAHMMLEIHKFFADAMKHIQSIDDKQFASIKEGFSSMIDSMCSSLKYEVDFVCLFTKDGTVDQFEKLRCCIADYTLEQCKEDMRKLIVEEPKFVERHLVPESKRERFEKEWLELTSYTQERFGRERQIFNSVGEFNEFMTKSI